MLFTKEQDTIILDCYRKYGYRYLNHATKLISNKTKKQIAHRKYYLMKSTPKATTPKASISQELTLWRIYFKDNTRISIQAKVITDVFKYLNEATAKEINSIAKVS